MSTAFLQDVVDNRSMHTKSRSTAGKVLHLKRPSSIERDEFKANLRAWLESVRIKTGHSLERIGKDSGVHPSNLTRFMKPGATVGIGLETIRKISNAYGIPAPGELGLSFQVEGFAEHEALPWASPTRLGDPASESNSIDWWIANTYLLDLEGILKGDKIAFDINRAPKPGDIVVAQAESRGGTEVETIIRKYEPPMLVCRTTLRDYPRPEYVDGHRIIIMGTMVALRRDMSPAAAAE